MAKKKSPNSSAKSLVIVESPAKARTISKFLGKNFTVEASIGHVRDLPKGAGQIPAEYRDQAWSRLGVNVEHDFDPLYIIPPGKTAQVRKLRRWSRTPRTCIWRRTRTARARPSVGISTSC